MTHELRKLLEEELAGETPPPLGDVVRVSVDSGRRVRRRRRLFAGAGGGAAAAVLAFAGLLALGTPPAPSGQAAGAPSVIVAASEPAVAAPPAATRSVVPSDPARCILPSAAPARGVSAEEPILNACPDEVRVLDLSIPSVRPTTGDELEKTTPAAALELLTALLPKGETAEYAYLPNGYAYVQTYLDRGEGPGMVRVYVGEVAEPAQCDAERICAELEGVGLLLVERNPTDCTRFLSVTLQRQDGVEVTLDIADCLMWDGRMNPAGAIALDLQEAVTVVLNPAWGPAMPTSLIKSGAYNYPKLNPIVGG